SVLFEAFLPKGSIPSGPSTFCSSLRLLLSRFQRRQSDGGEWEGRRPHAVETSVPPTKARHGLERIHRHNDSISDTRVSISFHIPCRANPVGRQGRHCLHQ
ncbi:unnamed protein product, partial [Ectocarpus sp. 12 AP-2014]